METTQFQTTVITAAEGKLLTQVGDVHISERIIATTLALGKNDSPDNYVEIDRQTADEYIAELKEYNKQHENEGNQDNI